MISKVWIVEIKGIKPLISNVRKRELDAEMAALKKDELAEWEENEKNWQRKAEADENGMAIIPGRWIRKMLVEACKKTGMVPHFATSKKQTYTAYVSSFLVNSVGDPLCAVDKLECYGTYVGAQGANSKTKVWKNRPQVSRWRGIFEIIDPLGRMKKSELEELMNYGGYILGIGDARALSYGRFETIKIKEKQNEREIA